MLDELHLHEALGSPPNELDNGVQKAADTRSHEDADGVSPAPKQCRLLAPPAYAGASCVTDRGSNQKKLMQRSLRISEGQCASASSSVEQGSPLRHHLREQPSDCALPRTDLGSSVVISGTGRRGPQHPRRLGSVKESTGSLGSWAGSAQRRRPSRVRKDDLDIAMSAAVAGVRPPRGQACLHICVSSCIKQPASIGLSISTRTPTRPCIGPGFCSDACEQTLWEWRAKDLPL